jgi:putative restriction endonuclease
MPCERDQSEVAQASFRDALLSAYRGRCAISHLPEPRLLDAARIVMGADEQRGQPIVSNGLCLRRSIMPPSTPI